MGRIRKIIVNKLANILAKYDAKDKAILNGLEQRDGARIENAEIWDIDPWGTPYRVRCLSCPSCRTPIPIRIGELISYAEIKCPNRNCAVVLNIDKDRSKDAIEAYKRFLYSYENAAKNMRKDHEGTIIKTIYK